ncbi:hypothetical protein YB2330_000963 [Saitoella coloradoensis]
MTATTTATTTSTGTSTLMSERPRSLSSNGFTTKFTTKSPYLPYTPPSSSSGSLTPVNTRVEHLRSIIIRQSSAPNAVPLSPERHHRRSHSGPRPLVKETLNAQCHDSEQGRMLNNYCIKEEIGRGSFGCVYRCIETLTGKEYAVKEFSKSRLRKRSQSAILRRPRPRPASLGAGVPGRPVLLQRKSASDIHQLEEQGNPLSLIKSEVAIMKKLNHENVLNLIEVLDDPTGDSLYMIVEIASKGVVMKVGLDNHSEPIEDEACRHYFRDLILGMEYLHAHNIVHRDIKPDNLLLTHDNILKIVDFGVSEIFEKENGDRVKKSAGSPAFMAPEICDCAKGEISGKAADIWAMGVTLFCLKYGHLPFERTNLMDLYECIKNDEPEGIPEDEDPALVDLFSWILQKDPSTRITMDELREHPWVTCDGHDPLLPKGENVAELVTYVTAEEVQGAIKGIRSAMTVIKAVNKLKKLSLQRRRMSSCSTTSDDSGVISAGVQTPALMLDIPTSNRMIRTKSVDDQMLSPAMDRLKEPFPEVNLGQTIGRPELEIAIVSEEPEEVDEDVMERVLACAVDARGQKPMRSPLAIPRIQTVLKPEKPELGMPWVSIEAPTPVVDNKLPFARTPPAAITPEPRVDTYRLWSLPKVHKPAEVPRPAAQDEVKMVVPPTPPPGYVHEPFGLRSTDDGGPILSTSPSGTDENIYVNAWRNEEVRIRHEKGEDAILFHNWRIDDEKGNSEVNPHGREKVERAKPVVMNDEERFDWQMVLDEMRDR